MAFLPVKVYEEEFYIPYHLLSYQIVQMAFTHTSVLEMLSLYWSLRYLLDPFGLLITDLVFHPREGILAYLHLNSPCIWHHFLISPYVV